MLDDFLVDPLIYVIVLLTWFLPVGWYVVAQRRAIKRRILRIPVMELLTAITSGATPGYEAHLFGMFHPTVLSAFERGAIRAMCRCVTRRYGKAVSCTVDTWDIRRTNSVVAVKATAAFQLAGSVAVEARWVRVGAGRHSFLEFTIAPPPGEAFDVLSFVNPSELAPFVERFATSLFSTMPTGALNMMAPSLKQKYDRPEVLAESMATVVDACGGLRGQELDMSMVDGRVIRPNPDHPTRVPGVEIQYAILGNFRDLRLTVIVVLLKFQCFVMRYVVEAQAPHMRQVVVDQDTSTILSA